MTLAGVGVLIPGAGQLAERCADAVRERGGDPVVAPVLAFRAPAGDDLARLANASARLRGGGYDWLAVTSPRAVAALRGCHGLALAEGTRVAAVGGATAAALRDAGVEPDFVPADATAAALVAEWPEGDPGRVFVPQSSLAHPTLVDGLTARGHEVDAVTAYVTVPRPLDEATRAEVANGRIRAAIVTSGSVGRALADALGDPPPVAIVSIGPQTTADLTAAGLTVAAESQERTAESLVTAVELALTPTEESS
ncbi:uroporphyrinogen-III synthase [Gulosibacter faecalis]|nr:uroporphyrinogen-III synthase [Gulosibacter faecalis]